MSSTSLRALIASFLLLVSSSRSSEEDICLPAKDSRNYRNLSAINQSPSKATYIWACTYHLKLVLPELLLPSPVEEGKVANMMHKNISQYGKLRLLGSNLAVVRLEGGTEST